jgi:hypothetical protein
MMGVAAVCVCGMLLSAGRVTAQRVAPQVGLMVVPPSPGVFGRPVTLQVRPSVVGTTYRYVATLIVTGTGVPTAGTACAIPQSIGIGSQVSWTPASGAYRLTVHRIKSLTAHDSASVSYQVDAPNGGFLNVAVFQSPNPQPPGRLLLSLHTNDRGAGDRYQWLVTWMSSPGAPVQLPVTWTGETDSPSHTVPFDLVPGTYNVSVRVGIQHGDACRIVETSRGVLGNKVIH